MIFPSVTLSSLERGCHMTLDTETGMESRSIWEDTTLYQEFLAQKEEIMRHKWIESERAGHDIGFDVALVDWVTKHRAGWLRWWHEHRGDCGS